MSEQARLDTFEPTTSVEHVKEFHSGDLNDLCDAADASIADGNGLGWLDLPIPEEMKRYWNGIVPMPSRDLFVARLDGVICGACQTVKPRLRNEAQGFHIQIITHFVAPWARDRNFTRQLFGLAEEFAIENGFKIINLDIRETLTETMRLYEMLGFRRYGEHPAHTIVDGKVLKGYYYTKIIDPSLAKTMEKQSKK
ncbi:MAG: GNAT family N-acetyltransferase [Alphaproteobacteria bacterium]|nr:GNAT family N-acetyltransferase [Alphaproteobacteria bacterium]